MTSVYHGSFKPNSTHQIQLDLIPDRSECTVLEIGCNTGYIGERFSQTKFYGLEVDLAAANQAARKYCGVQEVDLNRVNLETFEFEFQKVAFDVLLAGDVLEHLLHPQEVLCYFLGFVKHGGRVIISLPNVANIRIRVLLLFGRFDYTDLGILDRTHLHLYTKASAIKEFSPYFDLASVYYGSSNFGWILKRIPALGPLIGNTIVLYGKK